MHVLDGKVDIWTIDTHAAVIETFHIGHTVAEGIVFTLIVFIEVYRGL